MKGGEQPRFSCITQAMVMVVFDHQGSPFQSLPPLYFSSFCYIENNVTFEFMGGNGCSLVQFVHALFFVSLSLIVVFCLCLV